MTADTTKGITLNRRNPMSQGNVNRYAHAASFRPRRLRPSILLRTASLSLLHARDIEAGLLGEEASVSTALGDDALLSGDMLSYP
jgi:hypothetical protein